MYIVVYIRSHILRNVVPQVGICLPWTNYEFFCWGNFMWHLVSKLFLNPTSWNISYLSCLKIWMSWNISSLQETLFTQAGIYHLPWANSEFLCWRTLWTRWPAPTLSWCWGTLSVTSKRSLITGNSWVVRRLKVFQ